MSTEQHNAEMTMLHRNYMEGQARIKLRLRVWTERKDMLLQKAGSLDKMTERERMNYDVILSTIEDIEFFRQTLTAFALKHQDLYEKQVLFVEKIFKVKLLTEDFKKLETSSPGEFVNNLKEIFDGKEITPSA